MECCCHSGSRANTTGCHSHPLAQHKWWCRCLPRIQHRGCRQASRSRPPGHNRWLPGSLNLPRSRCLRKWWGCCSSCRARGCCCSRGRCPMNTRTCCKRTVRHRSRSPSTGSTDHYGRWLAPPCQHRWAEARKQSHALLCLHNPREAMPGR